ncbi:MAG: IPT/TIG domain-containing protein, partial [candidate division NC10 bacterium]|nr:IPT/TIG domain-containing protein [candidate division NC10 bacterium]
AEYVYDAVGNILQIKRFNVVPGAAVAITLVTPNRGSVGTTVQIFGKGFSTTPGENQVAFNGVAAPVLAASAGSLTTQVPSGATTGFITLTTPLGSATSPEPFTVLQDFAVIPAQATVIVGKTFRFEATLGGTVTSAVTWRVNGLPGGNASLGMITPEGLYTAPAVPPAALLAIEAVLTADLSRVAAAQVEVVPLSAGALATATLSVAPPLQPALTANPLAAAGVSVSPVPVITGVAPGNGARGTTITVTLTGAGLGGATALTVLRNGAADSLVTVSNLSPAPDGTSLTATLTIDAAAEVGGRILQVIAGGSASTALGTGTNAFTVN